MVIRLNLFDAGRFLIHLSALHLPLSHTHNNRFSNYFSNFSIIRRYVLASCRYLRAVLGSPNFISSKYLAEYSKYLLVYQPKNSCFMLITPVLVKFLSLGTQVHRICVSSNQRLFLTPNLQLDSGNIGFYLSVLLPTFLQIHCILSRHVLRLL